MPARRDISSILIIGSGPIIIGQACEFDYSGTQAVQALKEEGYRVILVNPNPATMMTTVGLADAIYMEPLTCPYVEEVIKKERPDAILTTMGGQTGLQVAIELFHTGVLDAYQVQIIGAGITSIELAEDRRRFKEVINSLGLDSPRSVTVRSLQEAQNFLSLVGLPLIFRPSYTLGGKGGGIARTEEEFIVCMQDALRSSPIGEVLVEESLIGWKEFELEVMRDQKDNAIIVCSIENVDPMGIHTGDSITVAPIQTLSDAQYQRMRLAAIDILRAVGVDCGGSNVQFALDSESGRMVVIEMNPRVSRSSALASKATGFPIARCSAKLAVGYTLDEVLNEITGATASSFEPAIDYCAVKIPRFEMEKFPMPLHALGTQMKSVGESLALGRTFCEALQKAFRSNEQQVEGLVPLENILGYTKDDVPKILSAFHPLRICAAYSLLCSDGYDAIEKIVRITSYDHWFVYQLYRQSRIEIAMRSLPDISQEHYLEAKRYGFSDKQLSEILKERASCIDTYRFDEKNFPVAHLVDTCSGEFNAKTPYCYLTYKEVDELTSLGDDTVIIIASGPNRVGQGLEFDTCCTLASLAYRKRGKKTVMINANPETVSTDFTISDRLYLEPVHAEHVLHIIRREKGKQVVVQLGGQTPLRMIETLHNEHIPITGTSYDSMAIADDRGRFSHIITTLGLKQTLNKVAHTVQELLDFAQEVTYPILLRPSHVLGGSNMEILYSEEELQSYIATHSTISEEHALLVDHFLEDAFEYDLDAVSDGQSIFIGGILQHIEAAGIHSGDSAAVFPPYKSTQKVLDTMKQAALHIAQALQIKGFMNIQFAVQDNEVYIIEVNPRASRTVPFINKTANINLVDIAVAVWEGESLIDQKLVDPISHIGEAHCKTTYAIKEAVFSFDRFPYLDPQLGPEMRSTGEVAGLGETFGEAFAKSQIAAGTLLPKEGRVCISVHKRDRKTIIPLAKALQEMGFDLAATRGTARDLYEAGIMCETVLKTDEGHPNLIDHMRSGRIDLLINTPMGQRSHAGSNNLRSEAMKLRIPYTTTTSAAAACVEAILFLRSGSVQVRPL